MFSKRTQRIIMGVTCFFIALTIAGLLDFINIKIDSDIYNIPLKGIFFIALSYIGYYLIYNKDLI